jgi:hypothetical protein
MALFYHPAFCSKIALRQHDQHCGVADLHKLVSKRAGYAKMTTRPSPGMRHDNYQNSLDCR